MAPTQIGSYRIVRLLGEGGMGTVYEALQDPIQRRVALKVLLPQYAQNSDVLKRFFNEARVVNLIEHPSIVQVSDYGQAPDGTAYLVMEYLRGESLSSRLDRLHRAGERLRVVAALQLAAQIADALAAAHEKSVVHRDLKPANIMLVGDSAVPGNERAKILDFGIAKLTQGQAKGTATNAVLGTPQYMSPEQCRGAGGVDDKTDVYALGVMLYEMLAGRPPFLADGAIEYMGQHVFGEPPPLRDLAPATSAAVATLVHRLLVKGKEARPSMKELNAELVRLLTQFSNAAVTLPPPMDPDLDKTRQSVVPTASPSTLGGSLGQTLQPAVKRRVRALTMLAVSAGVGLLIAGTAFRWGHRPHAIAVTAPAFQPPSVSSPSVPLTKPAASLQGPASRVSAPALATTSPPALETLKPPEQDKSPQPKHLLVPPSLTLQRADHSLQSGDAKSAKPPLAVKPVSATGSKNQSKNTKQKTPQPLGPIKPTTSVTRAEDYEP